MAGDKNMKDNRVFILYRHKNLINNKVYIGITSLSPNERWANGLGYKGCKLFFRAILKYGWNNFTHEILFNDLSKEKACNLEKELIHHYKNLGLSYNLTDGGEGIQGFKHSEESKNKIRQYLLSNRNSRRGAKVSSETVRKLRESHKNPIDQYTLDGVYITSFISCSEASRVTGISNVSINNCVNNRHNINSAKGYIFVRKGDHEALSLKIEANKTKCNNPIVIQQFKDGKLIASYNSIREASRITGIDNRNISKNIKGLYKHAGGFQWRTK